TLSSARAVLDFPRTSGSVIEAGERNYRLALVDRDVVDIDEFSSASSVALAASGTARSELLRTAAEHWTGEPLPEDRYQEWAAPTRARLIDLYAQVLDALADDCSAAGDQAGALDAAARHVEFDPLNEAAHQRLMLGYARSG